MGGGGGGGGAADTNSETKNSPKKNMPIYFYFSLGVEQDPLSKLSAVFLSDVS
jgi:hypothetical protein